MPQIVNVDSSSSEHREARDLAALVQSAAAGDDSAIAALYEQTVSLVYSLALSILGSTADAEEITEDVFVKVWHQCGQYDAERGTVQAWLLTICRSKALDCLRARRRRQRLQSALAEQPADVGLEAAQLLIDDSRLGRAISTLSATQQQVLVLSYFRGHTHQEISDALDMKLGTVKTHIRRTLIALRELLQA